MLKNQWMTFMTGKIIVKVTGKGIERLINILIRREISIWNVKRVGTEAVIFTFALQDLHRFRHAVRKSECKVTFLFGRGIPFMWKRTKKNSGFMIGAGLFIFTIMLLSNMVWDIEVNGASPETEHTLKKALTEMGIRAGSFQFLIPDAEYIQEELTMKMDNITWVGVELKGTTFHFQVVEKTAPDEKEMAGPQHLVATKAAVVSKIFVEEGKAEVKVHEYVKKGQILVSGLIGKEEQLKAISAKGEILGETWYTSTVTVPLETEFDVLTGEEKKNYSIQLGDISIPIWGFSKPEYSNYQEEETSKHIKFLKWQLPIAVDSRSYKESEAITRIYTKKDATKAALELAREDLLSTLPQDVKILNEKVLHAKEENGKVKVNIHFKVLENIAIGQPIIQGELE
ncbi:sporulation protein YqfD [Bacillus spongiae]|uniref:Sporulation protein YqfD n=1 Tax=Bacillus spongiae TaxID=2683610 RepID=A0ABU8H977_9BACI